MRNELINIKIVETDGTVTFEANGPDDNMEISISTVHTAVRLSAKYIKTALDKLIEQNIKKQQNGQN